MPRKPVYTARKPAKKYVKKRSYVKGRGEYVGPTIRGRGAYKHDYGHRLGGVVGEGLQELLSQINPLKFLGGFGDYAPTPFARNIKSNTLSMGNDPPEIRNSSLQEVVIRHREFLGDVVTAQDDSFNVTSYALNPGLFGTFPWLSTVATSFEQYRLQGVIFEFKSTSADALNSANTALGSVIMATEYDATRPAFASKISMENHQYSSSAKQSCSMLHPIECARQNNVLSELYVRGEADKQPDLRFTDFGNFQIATVGQQGAGVTIGELWITYEIALLKPIMPVDSGNNLLSAHIMAGSGVTTSNVFPTAFITGSMNATVSGANKNIVTIPGDNLVAGQQFIVILIIRGTGTASVVAPALTIGGSFGGVNLFNGDSTDESSNVGTSLTLYQLDAIKVNTTGADGTLTYAGGTFPTTIVTSELFILPIESAIPLPLFGDSTPASLMEELLALQEKIRMMSSLNSSRMLPSTTTPFEEEVEVKEVKVEEVKVTSKGTEDPRIEALRALLGKK